MVFTSPAGTSSISSNNGGAYLFTSMYTNPGITPVEPSLTATSDQLIANVGLGSSLHLYFTTQEIINIQPEEFTGNVVAFSPSPTAGAVTIPVGSSFDGLIIDNSVDPSNPASLFGVDPNRVPGAVQLNRTFFPASHESPLIIGSIAAVPEPAGLMLVVVGFVFLLAGRNFAAISRS